MGVIFCFDENRKQEIVEKRCAYSLLKSCLNSRKAQGMSLNTVIIAIIVLVVLVVLVMIFTGYFGKVFAPTVGSCAAGGGTCAPDCGKDEVGRDIGQLRGYKCDPTTLKCCQRASEGIFGNAQSSGTRPAQGSGAGDTGGTATNINEIPDPNKVDFG